MEQMREVEIMQAFLEGKKYGELREYLAEQPVADVAEWLEELEEEQQLKMFRILPKSQAADVFSYLDMDNQHRIITSLTDKEAAGIINNLMADDATDMLEEMPANVVKKLLAGADPAVRRDINSLLQYPEDSAGSIMTVEYVELKEKLTVNESIELIRNVGFDSETIDVCYVLDPHRHLIGMVDLRQLLFAKGQETIGEIMDENVISVHTHIDQEEVARQFQKYDFFAMPVVDNEKRLVGIITVDDVVDILQEETTEDMEMMAAILPSDKPYMRTGVWETFKKRILWLVLLMLSATFTGSIISSFEDALSVYVALTAFIPMLMNTGGNAGGQASVMVIRGLSLGEIEYRDVPRVLWKELRVAVLCGAVLAVVSLGKLMLLDRTGILVAAAVCVTLFVSVIIAMIVGCLLPVGAKRLGLDPAVMASPFITTIVDAVSLLIYFQVATTVLGI